MLSHGSILPFLLALAAVTTMLESHALPPPPPASGLHSSPLEKAGQYFTAGELARGRVYARGRYLLVFLRLALTLGLFAVLALTPLSTRIHDVSVSAAGGRVWLTVMLFGLLLGLLYYAVTFPLSLYGNFLREHTFGLSNQTFASWALDYAKGALISTGIMLPLLILLYALIRWSPGRWYLPAWAAAVTVMVLIAELSPILIDPLFHTFKPVQDPGLVERIHTLTDRAGLRVGPILEMDASRKTKKTNAYFTGLGRARRVVLYDTLIATSSPEEVELVLAHELGHWTRHHTWKGIALGAASLLAALWLIAGLLNVAAASGRFGFIHPADVKSLPLLLLSFFILNIATMPIQQAISRAFERQADLESLHLTNNPDAFIAAEITLARSNLADIEPPQAIVWFLYTHPPVLERIAMAEAFRTGERR
ncbi:MAG: M48 family metallopeptidase [Candidatus Methylomirabilis sp.]